MVDCGGGTVVSLLAPLQLLIARTDIQKDVTAYTVKEVGPPLVLKEACVGLGTFPTFLLPMSYV